MTEPKSQLADEAGAKIGKTTKTCLSLILVCQNLPNLCPCLMNILPK